MEELKNIENKLPEKMSIGLVILNITLICLVISFSFMVYKVKNKKSPDMIVKQVNGDVTLLYPGEIEAKSAYVYDVVNKKSLFEKNPKESLPLASLTKIMTAWTAREILPKDSLISIKKDFLEEEGDSGLLVSEKWKFSDLLDYSLVVSSNDGARSIASVAGSFSIGTEDFNKGREFFIEKMNVFAKNMGLLSMDFKNETGIDGDFIGGKGNVEDVAKLLAISLEKYPDMLEATVKKNININSFNAVHSAKNTNIFVEDIPGLLASKTGWTTVAGGNLAIAMDVGIGRPIVIVVLGGTLDGRFSDVLKLASSTIHTITQN